MQEPEDTSKRDPTLRGLGYPDGFKWVEQALNGYIKLERINETSGLREVVSILPSATGWVMEHRTEYH